LVGKILLRHTGQTHSTEFSKVVEKSVRVSLSTGKQTGENVIARHLMRTTFRENKGRHGTHDFQQAPFDPYLAKSAHTEGQIREAGISNTNFTGTNSF
jgi:hypothetical protein